MPILRGNRQLPFVLVQFFISIGLKLPDFETNCEPQFVGRKRSRNQVRAKLLQQPVQNKEERLQGFHWILKLKTRDEFFYWLHRQQGTAGFSSRQLLQV